MLNTSYKKISVAIATAILMNGCSSLVNPGDNSEAKTVQVAERRWHVLGNRADCHANNIHLS